jgi:hypothetical protein
MGEYLNWSYEAYWVRKKTRELEVCLIESKKTYIGSISISNTIRIYNCTFYNQKKEKRLKYFAF